MTKLIHINLSKGFFLQMAKKDLLMVGLWKKRWLWKGKFKVKGLSPEHLIGK